MKLFYFLNWTIILKWKEYEKHYSCVSNKKCDELDDQCLLGSISVLTNCMTNVPDVPRRVLVLYGSRVAIIFSSAVKLFLIVTVPVIVKVTGFSATPLILFDPIISFAKGGASGAGCCTTVFSSEKVGSKDTLFLWSTQRRRCDCEDPLKAS